MIKAIIWDIGGVLAKMQDLAPHRNWEERLGLQRGQLAKIVFGSPLGGQALIGQVTEEDFWLDLGKQLGLPPEDAERLRDDFYQASAWDTKLLALIQSLKPQFKMGIISGAMSDARELVHAHGNAGLFDVMVFSAEEGIQKPDPAIYQRALSRLGVEAQEAIFIDDWLESVEGAQSVGLHGIHYMAGVDVEKEIDRITQREQER